MVLRFCGIRKISNYGTVATVATVFDIEYDMVAYAMLAWLAYVIIICNICDLQYPPEYFQGHMGR